MSNKTGPIWGVCLAAATALAISGCGTLSNIKDEEGMSYYGGVSTDLEKAADTDKRPANTAVYAVLQIAALADIPLSAVGDTLTLPWVYATKAGWTGGVDSPPVKWSSLADPPAK
jgi:uncharacterized protein YceK